jgi:hypothetical protein
MEKKYKQVAIISCLVIVIIIGIIIIKEINSEKKEQETRINDATRSGSYEKPDDDKLNGYWLNENNELLNISAKNQEYFIYSLLLH